jgi:pimeloyl-ACP methyl ester carboxylesterase
MAYARVGNGPKTVLAIPGGPGNGAPTLRAVPGLPKLVGEGYTCWVVTRRRGMPPGHSIADMADDYAALIAEEFGGRIDMLLGVSMGGMIGFYIAGRHPSAVGRFAAVCAAAQTTEEGKAGDLAFARALADGRMGDASVAILGVTAPHIPRPLARALAPVMAPFLVGDVHPTFGSDVVVEAEAADAYDARDVLPSITVPVLIVGGDQDRYFPLDHYEETARLIPGAALRIHPGQGHVRTVADGATAREVLEFALAESPGGGLEADHSG